MKTTSKQRVAMALIVLVGLLAAAAVLLTDRHAGDEHDHDAEHAHEAHESDAHGKPQPGAPGAGASQQQGHEHGKEDDKDHGKAPGTAHGEAEAHGAGEVKLTAEQIQAAGITVQAVGPARLQGATGFPGEVRFNDDRTAHVVPRLAGVAETVPVHLGQQVHKGQVLATLASTGLAELRSELLTARKRRDAARITHDRELKLWEEKISARQDLLQAQGALQEADLAVDNAAQKLAALGAGASSGALNRLELRAPFAGTVVEKHLSAGEAVKEDASVFTVSDLSSVWAEFAVAPKDLASVRVGQRVTVSSTAFDGQAEGTVSYVGALLGEQTRTARARVTLNNPQGAWRPGLFVTVNVLGDAREVPITVAADAVQSIDGQPTVFKVVPGGFVAVPLKVGRTDGRTVEVLAGLKAGDAVASSKAFVLKSELGKASAEHTH